jgi:hypothetical protein
MKVDLAKPLPDSLPFHPSLPLSVAILMNGLGKVVIYRDDSVGVVPDIDGNARRVNRPIPLAIHALARPLSENDCLPRKVIISLKNGSRGNFGRREISVRLVSQYQELDCISP